jgi:Protein of unknown function (DUF3631)/Domain of unknown function (DUF3854)
MNLCRTYLADRGITDETVKTHGLEFDDRPDGNAKTRLGRTLPKSINEVLWFPLHDKEGNVGGYIARPLPNVAGQPKFRCPDGSSGAPYIPKPVFKLEAGRPLIITEGPVKALACLQAGVDAIGLNGVYGAGVKHASGEVKIRADLLNALEWGGRKTYLGFDADQDIKPDVRRAMFRLYFLLSTAGAEVYQLTSWDVAEGKGIDDYLVNQFRSNGEHPPADVLSKLLSNARPFIETIKPTSLDLGLIGNELGKVHLPDLCRQQLCRELYNRLNVPLDSLRAIRPQQPAATARAYAVDPEPWPDLVDCEDLLHEIAALIRCHVVLGNRDLLTVTLWVVLTYVSDIVDILPLLAIVSPDKRCGKTSLLGVLSRLVKRPLPTSNISPAALYRAVEKFGPTLLVDEADAFLEGNGELRGVLNSGHTREAAFVLRANRETGEVETFSTWGPKAVSLIGKLPATLSDRSLVISMTRRKPGEKIEKLRNSPPNKFEDLRRRIVRWVENNQTAIASANPQIPQKLNDRAGDNWFPLLAIAMTAGPSVHDLALRAIAALPSDDDEDSVITVLLLSLRRIFRERGFSDDADFLATDEILKELNADKEAPSNWRNDLGISAEKLATQLKDFRVRSVQKQINNVRTRGYEFGKLRPVFERYLTTV